MRGKPVTGMLLAFTAIFMACEPKPQPVQFGSDPCTYCRMLITETGFASQTVNSHGRSYPFDSIECLVAHHLTSDDHEHIHSHWVPDLAGGDEWVRAEKAIYLQSETLRSPMGLYLSAFSDRETAEEYQMEYRGTLLDWEEVWEIVRKEWLADEEES